MKEAFYKKLNIDNFVFGVLLLYLFDMLMRDVFGLLFIDDNIIRLFVIIVSLIYLFYNVLIRKEKVFTLDMILLIVLFGLSICSVMSADFKIALPYVVSGHFIWFFLIYYYFRRLKDKNELMKKLLITFFTIWVLSSFQTCISFVLYFIESILKVDLNLTSWTGKLINGRYSCFFPNPNPLGHLAFMGIATAGLLISKSQKKLNKLILAGSIGINLIIMYLSNSRSAMLAVVSMVICIVIYLLLKYIKDKNSRRILVVGVILVFILAIYYVIVSRFDGVLSFNNIEQFLDDISSARYSIWKSIIIIKENNILLGNGHGTLVANSLRVLGENAYIVREEIGIAHNIFFEVYYSMGLIGLIVFSSFFGFIVVKSVKLFNQTKSFETLYILLVLLGTIMISLLDAGILYSGFVSPLFWLLCGFVVSKQSKN
ncbi:MAG: O-antigen ligase family protein [Anaerorhabdus sp.]|uniref:O-antigen ligase family protein n=1 Tax=Anaerorhabdus sp. TaxID=1872524 RepID=UPI002FC60649